MAWSTSLKLLVKRASSSEWNSDNPILNSGELGLETDTGYVKIGKGNTWSNTTYLIKPTQSMPSGIIPSNSQVGTSIEYARADHCHSFPTYDKLTQSCLSTETKFRDFIFIEDYEIYNNAKYDTNDKLISAEIKFSDDSIGTVFVERFGDYKEYHHFIVPDKYYYKLVKVYDSNKLIDKYLDNTGIVVSTNLVPFSKKYNTTPAKTNNTGYQTTKIYKYDTTPTYISCGSKILISRDDDIYTTSFTISNQGLHTIYIKLDYDDLGTTTDYLAISGIGCQDIVIPIDIYIGNGTSANPYPVACPAQLNDVRNGLSSYYLQLCNIALDPNTHFPSIGTYSNEFTGTYDGDNYKITNFFENTYNSSNDGTGLFGCVVSPGILKNIWLYGNIDIPSSIYINRIGLLCGYNWNTTINCHVFGSIKCRGYRIGGLSGNLVSTSGCSAEVDIEGLSGSSYIGGLAGSIDTTFTNNYSKCNIRGYGTYIGGLTGLKGNYNFKFENCYSQSVINMTSATAVGGFVGIDNCIKTTGNYYYSNCYANTTILGAGTTKKGFCGSRVDGCTSTQTNCLWNKEISDIEEDTLLPTDNGLKDNKMRDNNYLMNDFNYSTDYWFFKPYYYPRLKWENTYYPKT